MSTIKAIKCRMILDSRGFPTTEVDLTLANGTVHRAACPSGASTGVHEALELRDGDKTDFHGKNVKKALANIREIIAPAVIGMDVLDQAALDKKLEEIDGTENKTFRKLGANAALPVSMAAAVAAANFKGVALYEHLAELAGKSRDSLRLPTPCMNIINGGKHAGNKLAPQEYMVCSSGASSMYEAMKWGSEVYHHLKNILKAKFGIEATAVGDEGGFAPAINDAEEPLRVICAAIEKAGLTGKMGICMDAAASEFYDKETKMYNLNFKGEEPKLLSGEQLSDLYVSWCKKYPIVSIEDPFDEDDFESFAKLLATIKAEGLKTQIVGDDLTVSQVSRVRMAVEHKACNALLLKVNQVGTVSGAINAANLAMSNGWAVMASHRSGETEDTFISHLAILMGQLKTGAPCRSERTAKYNELLRIEEAANEKGMPIKFGYDGWKN